MDTDMERKTEELILRWKARRDIENLMGQRFSLNMLRKTEQEWETLWCKKAPEPLLGFNSGSYRGYEAIAGYFAARRAQDLARGALAAGPAKASVTAPEETAGLGSLNLDPLTTPVIEIAGDMQRARGLWYIAGLAMDVGQNGPECAWKRGKLAADFVCEDGEWRIWRLLELDDIFAPAGTDWAVSNYPAENFAPCGVSLPKAEAPGYSHRLFDKDRPMAAFPPAPQPYRDVDWGISAPEPGASEYARALRINDVMEIKNLMGRRMFFQSYGMTGEEFEGLWTENGAVYTQNDVCIRGLENIRWAFENKAKRLGTQRMEMHPLTTPLIEIAGDGKTAQGFWYSLGQRCEAGGKGAWVFGRFCADFIREKNGWRIWRLFSGTDSSIEAGTSRDALPSLPVGDTLCDLSPEDFRGVETQRGVFYDPTFNWSHFPALPIAYDSFGSGVWNMPIEEVR